MASIKIYSIKTSDNLIELNSYFLPHHVKIGIKQRKLVSPIMCYTRIYYVQTVHIYNKME